MQGCYIGGRMSPRILVAEDSPPIAAALRRALEGAGYAVDVLPQRVALAATSSGVHAVAVVHADRIGAELAGKIKALLLDRLNFCRSQGGPVAGQLTMHTGWQDLNRRLFAAAAEAAKKTGK